MPFTIEQLESLLANREQEGLYLEFKRGLALRLANDARRELIKDCTGFANAAGGLLLYGIAEETVDGVDVAAGVDAVPAGGGDSARISEILRSNTSPPLSRFEITELALPNGGGRVVAIQIEAGATAHQNLIDLRYYQRAGSTTVPMTDFQIRDVMNRRSKPEVAVVPRMRRALRTQELHRYLLEITLTNTGMVSLAKWRFELDVPAEVVRDTSDEAMQQLDYEFAVKEMLVGGHRICRVGFGDPHPTGASKILHPQQSIDFRSPTAEEMQREPLGGAESDWYPRIVIELDHTTWNVARGRDIPWRLYLMNAAPIMGLWSFDEWCQF